ncbi:MAG: pitrilysin family protein [Patescibacteria group bacterium]|jgi:predicted Zn-dependent peptidase
MNITLNKLTNGLPVISINTETFGSITMLVMVKVGSRYEDEKNNGISHFLEHATSKSIPSFPTPFSLASAIEGVGGVSNAFTSREYTGFWIKLPTAHLLKAGKILYETVTQPLLKEDEIQREKGVIVEEIHMYEDEPQRKVGELYEKQLYPKNPLGFDIAGKPQTVNSMQRSDFVGWLQKYYHSHNAIVALAGNLGKDVEQVKHVNSVHDIFSHWTGGKVSGHEPVSENQKKPVLNVVYKKTQQTHFVIGYRAFSFFDKRRYILSVLSRLLGGGMSSRLFNEVREKRGLCYYIYTSKDQYDDVGHISTQAGVSTDIHKIKQALSVIVAEHKSIAQGKVTEEEITRTKEMIKGHVLLSLEDSYSVANFFAGEQLLFGAYKTPEEVISSIDTVTRDEIVSLAKDLFIEKNLNITVLGPLKKNELELGDILG